MKKKVFRIFAIILLAMLIRHFYPKSELLQPELSKMQEQIEENWDNGMPRPNDEVITTEKELSGNEQPLNLTWNGMKDGIVYFGTYDGLNTEYLLANKEYGTLHTSSIDSGRKTFYSGDNTIDGFIMLYPLFDFNDGVIHAGYGIFDPCKITVSDPRIDSPAPIRKTSCNFIYLRHTNQSLISGYIVDNKNSLTILKRYNREARVLETIGSLDMLFILDDVQSEYLIGKKYPCLDCDVGPYDTIVFNTLTKKVINLGPIIGIEINNEFIQNHSDF